MASVSYNARERRVVVEGPCWAEDADGIVRAVEVHSDAESGLVVDLTRMPYLPRDVALAIGEARRTAEGRGCRVRVWTDPTTPTAATLAAACADVAPTPSTGVPA